MEAFVRLLDKDTVLVRIQPEPQKGLPAGDVTRELRAGDLGWGYSYKQWCEMGEGSHEIKSPKG